VKAANLYVSLVTVCGNQPTITFESPNCDEIHLGYVPFAELVILFRVNIIHNNISNGNRTIGNRVTIPNITMPFASHVKGLFCSLVFDEHRHKQINENTLKPTRKIIETMNNIPSELTYPLLTKSFRPWEQKNSGAYRPQKATDRDSLPFHSLDIFMRILSISYSYSLMSVDARHPRLTAASHSTDTTMPYLLEAAHDWHRGFCHIQGNQQAEPILSPTSGHSGHSC
tara:strand:- start:2 stop:682 length:681 start_codon:yes stop_codon:yes gene_type:complete